MAGEASVRVSTSYTFGGGTIGGTVATVNPDAQIFMKKTIPANSTNVVFNVAIDVTAVTIAAIEANKDCTVKTNSTSTPDDTLALVANQAVGWRVGDVPALFLTEDVTVMYVTTGAEATTLSLGVGYDATPGI